MSLFAEFKQRRVFRVLLGYGVAAAGLLQLASVVVPALHLPAWSMTALVVAAALGVPIAIVLAWVFDLEGGSLVRAAPATPEQRRKLVLVAAVALGVCAALVIAWQLRKPGAAPAIPQAGAVVVLPFAVRGSEQYAYLSEGLADLLGTALQAGSLRTVDGHALASFLSRDPQGPLDAESGRTIAAHFGAGLFVLGSVFEAEKRLRIRASLHDASGAAITEAHGEGTAGSLFELVDALAAQLRPGAGSNVEMLARRTSRSPEALKAMLEGEAAMRRDEFPAAQRSFRAALAADPDFAVAAYRLTMSTAWEGDGPGTEKALARAMELASKLAPADRKLLDAFAAFLRGEAATAEAIYRELIAARPDDVEAWYMLGEVLYHWAYLRGGSPSESRAAFERALVLDPGHALALLHVAFVSALERNADLPALVRRYREVDHDGLFAHMLAPSAAAMARSEEGIARAIADLKAFGSPAWGPAAALASAFDPTFEVPLRVLALVDATTPAAKGSVLAGKAMIAAARGRPAEMRGYLRESGPWMERLWGAVLGEVFPMTRRPLPRAPSVRREPLAPEGHPLLYLIPAPSQFEDDVVEGLIAALHGDKAAEDIARRIESRLENPGAPTFNRDLAESLRAHLAFAQGRTADALSALERIRGASGYFNVLGNVHAARPHDRLLRARLLAAAGRPEEALRHLGQVFMSLSERPFRAPSLLLEAELREKLGQHEGARSALALAEELWKDAEPECRATLAAARSRLASR